MTEQQHASTFIFNDMDKPECQLCHKIIDENRIIIIPVNTTPTTGPYIYTMKGFGAPFDFHLDCAIKMLCAMSGNRNGKFEYKILEDKVIVK